MMTPEDPPRLAEDGLALPEVGEWAETKYRLIENYASMFATVMKGKWDERVYLDLFAGAGKARIKDRGSVVPTSAMLALKVREPFDRYVFCDLDRIKLAALEARARRETPARNLHFVLGDCNAQIPRILECLPQRGSSALCFCVVDPFAVGDLDFLTIEALAERRVDFLVLIPSHFDAHRNLGVYLEPSHRSVERFLGDTDWRTAWHQAGARGFGSFLVDRFGQSMKRLGYLYDGPGEEVPIRNRGTLYYYLAFFSRHKLGRKFWREARRSSDSQRTLFE
jgi:three-Cys-motif partner protein